MSNLTIQKTNLPDTLEDLAHFVLFGREKLTAVRAAIRAIDKLNLAKEIREQKMEEASMLSDALLDAEVRLGELIREIPTNQGKRTDIELSDSGVPKSGKSKETTIKDLGLSKKQAQRFEILAEHKDIVEYVKAEAHENREIPTRTRVLDLASYQKKIENQYAEYDNFIDMSVKVYKELAKIIDVIDRFEMSVYRMDALRENFNEVLTVANQIMYIETAKAKLTAIEVELRKPKKHRYSYI